MTYVSHQDDPAGASPSSDAPARSPVAPWAAGVLAPLVALLLAFPLRAHLHPSFLFLFLGAVVAAGWIGGGLGGFVATALSLLLVEVVLTAPRGPFPTTLGDAVPLALFAVLGAGVSLLAGRMHAARRAHRAAAAALRGHAADLERANARLREQAAGLERINLHAQERAVEVEQQVEETRALNEELEAQTERGDRLRGELERANARLTSILETMVEGVLLVDGAGVMTYANSAAARILALPAEELVGRRYDDPRWRAAHPGGTRMSAADAPAARVLATGRPVHGMEVEFTTDAGRRVLRVSAGPLRDGGDAVSGVVASFDDVTADRLAEESLRESEARFRAMADTAPVLIWTSGDDGLRDWFNRPWLEFTGRPLADQAGNGWAEEVHPDDYPRCLTTCLSAFEARRSFRVEYRLRRADGEHRWVQDTGVPRMTPDGTFAGYIGSAVDVTEHREAELRQRFLAEAGTLLAASLDPDETLRRLCRMAVPVLADLCAVDVVDDDGGLRRVEAVAAEESDAGALGALTRFAPSSDAADPVAVAVRTGQTIVSNHPGAFLPAEAVERLGVRALMAVPLVAGGQVLGSILLCATRPGRRYDDAERRRAEELARRAALAVDNARLYARAVEANRAKSDFLAVMSHELRTPLNAILGYTDLFLLGVPAALPEPVRPQMLRVRLAARHLLELIDEILTFARLEAGQEEARAAPVTAATLAQDAAALVEPLALERGIAFSVHLPAEEVEMETDARKVKQVLANLLGNAVKFTEHGSATLTVRREGASSVAFVVEDTGVGITPEQLRHVFEPFWQVDQGLMRVHGGSGLGLAVARQLARLLGGDVEAESRPGEGSVFTLRLPLRVTGDGEQGMDNR